MSNLESLKELDRGGYNTTTVYRDPRQGMALLDKGRHRVYVFSFPDREEAKRWAEEKKIPSKYWEVDKQRVRVEEPFIQIALSTLPIAPKDVLEAVTPPGKK